MKFLFVLIVLLLTSCQLPQMSETTTSCPTFNFEVSENSCIHLYIEYQKDGGTTQSTEQEQEGNSPKQDGKIEMVPLD